MPSLGRSFFSSLGGFSPVNRLTGRAKRPGDPPSSSPTHVQAHPPKRRRTDEQDDDVAVVQSVPVAAGHNHQQQRLRKKPSEASIDILIQSSPDLSIYKRPRSRSRSASVLSGSQLDGHGGGSSSTTGLVNQDEMRLLERGSVSTPNHRRRRRKHKNSSFGTSEGGGSGGIGGIGGFGRPVNLQSPSPEPEEPVVIEDDASPVKPSFGSDKPNTNLSIDLSSSNGSAKGRFRDRMSNSDKTQGDMAPPQRKNGIYNNKTHSESVDELSEEYFPDPSAKRQQISRNPVIHLGEAPARAAGAAAEKRRQLQLLKKRERERDLQKKEQEKEQKKKEEQQSSPKPHASISIMVEAIIESPLQVKAAFRQPSNFFVADQDSGVSAFALTTKPPFVEELVPVDTARARSEKLQWLKIDLFHVRNLSYNVDSPILFITLPQGDHMGALMGLQFDSVDEVRRFASWAESSLQSQVIRMDQKSSPEQLKRKFDRCLAEVHDHKEFKELKDQKELKDKDNKDAKDAKDAKESTPAKVGTDKGSAQSSPAVNSEFTSFRRTRSSRNLNGGATETIDLDGNDAKPSGLMGSSPATSSDVVATGDRASRLRNRAARLPPSHPLLQDMEFERWTHKNPDWARDWRVPLTYSRTTVDKDDVARLDEGEFLNDNIINFYIQFLQDNLKLGNSPISSRVYFHNTFFYEKLRPRKGQKIAFDGVKRWTAKVDLFGYDYIIIPVNEHAHWWLAIICNVPKILDKALPESMKEKMPEVVVEELEAINGLEASATNSPDKSSAAPVDVDAHAEAHADDVQETGVYRFVPIDVDGPKPRPRSVVIDDEEKPSKQTSTSPPRPVGQRKDTPIDVDGSEAKSDDKHSQPIVLDSVEKDESQVQAKGAVSNKLDSSSKPAENASPASKSKSSSVEVSGSNNDDDDDDEVTEIKGDLVASASSSSAAAAAAATAKKPFRGGGAVPNSKKVFVPPGQKKDPKDPRIFTLDSLGSVHTASVDHLKQWMMAEIAERKNVKPEDPGRLGMTAKAIPQQENFCDCGVYLLLYIREFVKDPDGFIEDIVMRRERNWDTSAPDMRKQLRDLILHKQAELQRVEEDKKKKKKKAAPAGAGAGAGAGTAKRPTSTASLPPATTTFSADVPIPSSETTDQQTTTQSTQSAQGVQNQNDTSPTSSSPVSLEAGYSSPFLHHGSKSPNVFDEHKPHP